MFSFLLFLGILGIASVAVAALVGWLARNFPRSRNTVALMLTFCATFSLGFSVDLIGQGFTGSLPAANAIPPIFTWFGIGAFCQMLAFYTARSRWPLFTPHILNGILAAFAGLSHPCHFFVAFVLFFIATVLYVAKPRYRVALI